MSQRTVSVSPFKHPWWWPTGGIGDRTRSLDDWLILDISTHIRSKPDWETKYVNPTIVAKWGAELEEQKVKTKYPGEVFDYVLEELEWFHKLQSTVLSKGQYRIGPDDRIIYSDNAIDAQLAKLLAEQVIKLESEKPKDYHPGSENLVVDVVHPSLYHLEYGRTMIVEDGKLVSAEFDQDKIGKFKIEVAPWGISKRFQWLPALMEWNKETREFCFASYINNIHPIEHSALYDSIGSVFTTFFPDSTSVLPGTCRINTFVCPFPVTLMRTRKDLLSMRRGFVACLKRLPSILQKWKK